MFPMVTSVLISCEYLISTTSTLASLFFMISDELRDLCMAGPSLPGVTAARGLDLYDVVLIGNGSGHISAGEPSCCTGASCGGGWHTAAVAGSGCGGGWCSVACWVFQDV